MRLFVIVIIVLFGLVSNSFAQAISVMGRVTDNKTHQPIERVMVKLIRTNDNRIVAFTQTNSEGKFIIKKEIDSQTCRLEFTHIGYATLQREITPNKEIEVKLIEEETLLKEVVITPSKIRKQGDTITYVVSAFSAANDRTIGDVLKKMPGIEVSESGEIKYQGQQLNKFYVEGSDLLGGRYGLATNNISHKDVASVEIMENHQPVKALEDITVSTQPGLNIKLKETAKIRWAGTVEAGAGIPSLWNAKVFAMRFKKKVQSLNTYKGDNTGNMYTETNSFLPFSDFTGWNIDDNLPTYINVSPSHARGIGNDRSRFERKHNFTSNNLVKLGNGYDLLPEIIVSHNRRTSEYKSYTTYFLDNDSLSIEDKNEDSKVIQKSVSGKFQLKGNKEQFYLNNSLNFNLNWNETDMEIAGTYPNRQAADIKYKKIGNDFSILKRMGRKTISLQSYNEYAERPQSLLITKSSESPINQKIDISSFYSKNSAKYGFAISKVQIGLRGDVLYYNRWMENTLNDIKNDSRTQKFKSSLNTSLEYKIDAFNMTLELPVFYQHLSVEDESKSLSGINPSLNLNLITSSKTSFSLSGSYQSELPDERLFYTGSILSNYRILNTGYINFDIGDYYNTSASVRYKDVLKLFFADATISLSKAKRKKISNQEFIGDYIISGYIPANVKNENISISGSLSKGLEWMNGLVAIYPMWSLGKRTLVRNDVELPYDNQLYALRGKINSKILKWCNLDYNFSFSYNKFKMEEGHSSSYDQFSQSLTANFFLSDQLQFKYSIEHFRNQLDDENYKNFVLSDIMMSYLWNTRWEFSCFVKNIFNEKTYSYFTESDLISSKQEYKIRGRDVLFNVSYRF